MATILSSLRLHGGDAVFGVLPPLDIALGTELLQCTRRYCSFIASLSRNGGAYDPEFEASEDGAEGISEPGTDDQPGRASNSRSERSTHADPAVLCVCIASVGALSAWLGALQRGEARGASGPCVPPPAWSEDALAPMRGAVDLLEAEADRLSHQLSELLVELAANCATSECGDVAAWQAIRAWRQDARCSHGVQALAFTCQCFQQASLTAHRSHTALVSSLTFTCVTAHDGCVWLAGASRHRR